MASSDNISMAVFCDFENVALGVRDANYEKFDIRPVLERLLLKGSIVVKKAYCDWDRYKGFKAPMHEANFEMIEIPHVRQSGKNSADIRLVVDALDLCYTKSHVDTFVIVSGDSDFSPLVSKLRENAKKVIGVGVKQSTSDLLVANCDEFIFYDDLVREKNRAAAKRKEESEARKGQGGGRRPAGDDKRKEELEARKVQALEMVVETFDALVLERGDTGKIWASLLKDTLKRRRPDFNETYFGFRTFGNLLEEAQARGLFEFGRDEKSGTYVYRSANAPVSMPAPELVVVPESPAEEVAAALQLETAEANGEAPAQDARAERGRRGRGGRKGGGRGEAEPSAAEPVQGLTELIEAEPPVPAAEPQVLEATPVPAEQEAAAE
uniref:NYN domain-containing protein n=1 Tax=uncultured Massilia sp. TaxID=169973 RepID=UPI002582C0D1